MFTCVTVCMLQCAYPLCVPPYVTQHTATHCFIGSTLNRRAQRRGGALDRTTEIHPAGVGEVIYHKQLAHRLTV